MGYKARDTAAKLVNDIANKQQHLDILNKSVGKVITGVESRQTAMRQCIKEMTDKGIPAFVDAAGREWSPETYVNMDIKTTVSNTAHAMQDARCDEYGVDLIEISSHRGARPKCAQDQGKIYSRSDKNGIAHDGSGNEIKYEPWSSTSYGEPDGILGINCHHKKYPFVDGVNFRTYYPYEKDENDARYKELQEQRRLERNVRKSKNEADELEAAGDKEGAKELRKKWRDQRKEYSDYCDKHELQPKKDRLVTVKKVTPQKCYATIDR